MSWRALALLGVGALLVGQAFPPPPPPYVLPDPLDAGTVLASEVRIRGSLGVDAGLVVRGNIAGGGTATFADEVQAPALDAGVVRADRVVLGVLDAGVISASLAVVGVLDAGASYSGYSEANQLRSNTALVGLLDAGTAYVSYAEVNTLTVGLVDAGTTLTNHLESSTAFAHLLKAGLVDAGSVYTSYAQGDTSVWNAARVGAIDAGFIRADLLHLGILDAGIAWLDQARNPDGGCLHAPSGVEVDQGARFGFRGPGGDSFIAHTGSVLELNGGSGLKVATTAGFLTRAEATFGQLSANAIQCNGGSTNTELSVVAGTGGPSADAGLILRAGAPNGPVIAANDAGIWTPALRLLPWALNAAPACSLPSRGDTIAVLFPGGLSDGGFDAQDQVCDGEHWISQRVVLGISADAKAGSGPFYRLDSRFPGQVVTIASSIDTAGQGGGSFEVVVRQGGTVFCRGGTTCTAVSGSSFRMQCFGGIFYVSPDAGLAHAIVAELDGGCAQTPTLDFAVSVNRYGYPDPAWTAP